MIRAECELRAISSKRRCRAILIQVSDRSKASHQSTPEIHPDFGSRSRGRIRNGTIRFAFHW
jgi:hypothetical protein